VTKQVNSAFYGEPNLHAWLLARKIDALVLCGITTNHCCETTARMAGNLGYDVRFVLDATHTFDRGGLTADELARATEANLQGEFATVVATADVIA
jgi:nicotinamidase-related amidase